MNTTGGSGAAVQVDGQVVHKFTSPQFFPKLLAEANWLRWVSESASSHISRRFPVILDFPSLDSPVLTMQLLKATDARSIIMEESFDVMPALRKAIRFAFFELGENQRTSPWNTGSWCAEHLRISLNKSEGLHPIVKGIRSSKYLDFGQGSQQNPLQFGCPDAQYYLEKSTPPWVQVIHGDLHLGNVLVGDDGLNFYFVDPRGEWGGRRHFDAAYDIAKLLHEPSYVAARTSASPFVIRLGSTVTKFRQAAPSPFAGRLAKLSRISMELARDACKGFESDDKLIAARSTLYTGVLLISILRFPHSISYDTSMLLTQGLRWMEAGISAITEEAGLEECFPVWEELHKTIPSRWND